MPTPLTAMNCPPAIHAMLLVPLLLIASAPAGLGQDQDQAQAKKKPAQVEFVDAGLAKVFVGRYESAKHWALQAILLSSLGKIWDPAATPMVLDALLHKDRRLKAFAVEALRATQTDCLRHVATVELVEALVKKGLRERSDLFRSRIVHVLERIFLEKFESHKKWSSYWNKAKKSYAPAPYTYPEQPERSGRSVSSAFVERAFDLNQYGLEVAFCIDTTGSMQLTIDAARDGLKDIVAMLKGIAPDLRIGLTHYKDFTDFSDGAKVLVPLTKNVRKVQGELDDLRAAGGGDLPERVEAGLEHCLSREMGWVSRTNKLIVVIGDAPAHLNAQDKANEIAKNAHERPFGREVKRPPVTGSSSKTRSVTRPFVISAIAVGAAKVNPGTEKSFKAIAEAGGGTYGTLLTHGPDDTSFGIISHIITHSFGARYAKQSEHFVKVFLEYHRDGFFK